LFLPQYPITQSAICHPKGVSKYKTESSIFKTKATACALKRSNLAIYCLLDITFLELSGLADAKY
jgi:hypothetical protein